MNQQKMMDQINAVFGLFMTFFYIGVGVYLIIAKNLYFDKALRNIMGVTFTLYGIYRGIRSYQKIRAAFFTRESDGNFED